MSKLDDVGPGADHHTGSVPSRKPPTIYDIAALAGVNPSTVSRALSKPGRINMKTAERIHDAARQLNYRVNPAARALPTGRTGTIGLIVADITNPMFFDVVRGAERAAADHDCTLVLAEFRESASMELRTAHRLMPSVDGLILATPRLDPDEIRALAREKPVVVMNREVEGIASVVPDLDAAVSDAVVHLASLGHTTVSYLPGPDRSWVSRRRWNSIERHCADNGLRAVRLPSAQPVMDGGRAAAAEVVASRATAVIAYNDLQAIGLMLELTASSVPIPDAVSIIGFDNIFGSDFTTPPLTSIGAPHTELGMHAARSVFALLAGTPTPAPSVELATALVLRGSTGTAVSATG